MISKFLFTLCLFQFASAMDIEIARFGGCLNQTKLAEGRAALDPAFHCHYDSSSCLTDETYGDEIWLDPLEVIDQGHGPCTCDANFETNVYGFGCYDMTGTHAVKCTSTPEQCPEGWYHLGGRFNNHLEIAEQCTHGDAAFGGGYDADNEDMCAKRCTCHFHYQSREGVLDSRSTQHGLCYNIGTHEFYCAVSEAVCDPEESFYGSLTPQLENYDCTCEKTETGACLNGGAFAHCAVGADSCSPSQTFMTRNELHASNLKVDCRLCAPENVPTPPTPTPPTPTPPSSPGTSTDTSSNSQSGASIVESGIVAAGFVLGYTLM